MTKYWTLGLISILAACTNPTSQVDDARFATGSRTMVGDADYERLFAVNVDEGTLTRVDMRTRTLDKIDVGVEPTRIARAGNTYFVTLRGERGLAVFQDGPTGLDRLETIQLGCEPFGVVASEDGKTIYVTLSQENKTIAMDVESRTVTQEWSTPGEPRWLALHPNDKVLYVAPVRGGVVYTVETEEEGDAAVGVVELPETQRSTPDGVITLAPRVMGDMAVHPDGDRLIVPAIYVDNKSQDDLPPDVDPTTQYYANPLPAMGRFNPSVVEFPVRTGGQLREGGADAIFLASFIETSEVVRSYPNSITVSPDGLFYAASLEGSDSVVMIGALPYDGKSSDRFLFADLGETSDPLRHGFSYRPHVTVELENGTGPRGVVYTDDTEAHVHNFLSLSLSNIRAGEAQDTVLRRGKHGVQDYDAVQSNWDRPVTIESSVLSANVRAGRELFFSANNPDLVLAGSGVSCHTCHMDGRDDGLTWQLGPEVWQTPSLAGRVSDTHPVTWNKEIDSVASEARATSTIRMGGGRLSENQYAMMAEYIDFTREVDHPARGLDNAQTRLGKEVFERPEVGCAECHSGEAATDNEHHSLYGLESVNTPTLRGIAATGPYLHDGRAATIRDVLDLSRAGLMGDTSSLNEEEMGALEAYVLSL